jgi:hypothetical protein
LIREMSRDNLLWGEEMVQVVPPPGQVRSSARKGYPRHRLSL